MLPDGDEGDEDDAERVGMQVKLPNMYREVERERVGVEERREMVQESCLGNMLYCSVLRGSVSRRIYRSVSVEAYLPTLCLFLRQRRLSVDDRGGFHFMMDQLINYPTVKVFCELLCCGDGEKTRRAYVKED